MNFLKCVKFSKKYFKNLKMSRKCIKKYVNFSILVKKMKYYFPLKMALILILQKFPKTRKEVSFKMSQDSKWLSPFYSKYFAHTSFVQSSFFSINSRPRQKCNTQNKWTEKFPDWVVKGRTVLRRTQMLTRMNFDVLEERER